MKKILNALIFGVLVIVGVALCFVVFIFIRTKKDEFSASKVLSPIVIEISQYDSSIKCVDKASKRSEWLSGSSRYIVGCTFISNDIEKTFNDILVKLTANGWSIQSNSDEGSYTLSKNVGENAVYLDRSGKFSPSSFSVYIRK